MSGPAKTLREAAERIGFSLLDALTPAPGQSLDRAAVAEAIGDALMRAFQVGALSALRGARDLALGLEIDGRIRSRDLAAGLDAAIAEAKREIHGSQASEKETP